MSNKRVAALLAKNQLKIGNHSTKHWCNTNLNYHNLEQAESCSLRICIRHMNFYLFETNNLDDRGESNLLLFFGHSSQIIAGQYHHTLLKLSKLRIFFFSKNIHDILNNAILATAFVEYFQYILLFSFGIFH